VVQHQILVMTFYDMFGHSSIIPPPPPQQSCEKIFSIISMFLYIVFLNFINYRAHGLRKVDG